jgi:hypothetical protein
MVAGVVLIVVGLGLLWSARDAGEVNQDVVRWQAQNAPPGRWRRWLELSARVSPQVNVWVGRLFAVAAFVGGVILIARG